MPDRCGLMFLHQEALTSLHNGGIRAHEGHRVLLDLIAEEQHSPVNVQTHAKKHMLRKQRDVKMCEGNCSTCLCVC